jgi:ABC-type lipoprotein release transport system permease subunit
MLYHGQVIALMGVIGGIFMGVAIALAIRLLRK